METTLKTAPIKEPVSIDDVKKHMVIDDDYTDRDSLILSLISDAREWIEEYLWRKLITQTWYAYLEDWPAGDYIELPFGTLQSVTAIKYTDTADAESTWNSSEYIVGTDYLKGRVTLAYGYTWPNTTLRDSNPIEVEFKCGYGDDAADVPVNIKRGIYMMVAEMYENREVSIYGQTYSRNPLLENLMAMYRINQL